MNIHDLIRGNNRFWKNLYYDDLIETSDYQLSYCKNANEPWFNCAHAIASTPQFSLIEPYYLNKNLQPAFYTDTLNEQWLAPLLSERGYQEIDSQNENIWYLSLSAKNIKDIAQLNFNHSNEGIELRPVTTPDELKLFIEINRLTNQLPYPLADSLASNLQYRHVDGVEAKHFIVFKAGYPAGCGSVGVYNNAGFLAEGGTLPEYRQQKIHCFSMQQRCLYAFARKASHIFTTCDVQSFTNHSASRLGMKLVCVRRFFQKPIISLHSTYRTELSP